MTARAVKVRGRKAPVYGVTKSSGFGWKADVAAALLCAHGRAMRAGVSIRAATESDLCRIAYVWHASASSMDAIATQLPTLDEMRSRVYAELEAGWALFLAERDHQIVAMLALKPSAGVLDQIFVLPEAQGSGVGAALLAHAKEMMPSGFALRVAEENRRAAGFYERYGLEQSGTGLHPLSGRPVRYYEWKVC